MVTSQRWTRATAIHESPHRPRAMKQTQAASGHGPRHTQDAWGARAPRQSRVPLQTTGCPAFTGCLHTRGAAHTGCFHCSSHPSLYTLALKSIPSFLPPSVCPSVHAELHSFTSNHQLDEPATRSSPRPSSSHNLSIRTAFPSKPDVTTASKPDVTKKQTVIPPIQTRLQGHRLYHTKRRLYVVTT